MEFLQLTVFKAIVEHGSLRKAAEFLHKTQPALSVSLKNLEEELGFPLFDRNQYRLKLTEKGHRFWQGLQIFNEAENQLQELIQDLQSHEDHVLNVAIDSAAPFDLLIPILQSCEKSFPSLRLNLRFGIMNQSMEWLKEGIVEMAIGPYFHNSPNWTDHFLFNQKLIPCIHKKHTKNGKVSLQELRNIPNIVVTTNNSDDPFILGSIKGANSFSVSNNAIKEQLILEGFGWGRIAEHRLQSPETKKKVLPIQLKEFSQVQLQFHLVWDSEKPLSASARLAKEKILTHFNS